MIVGLCVSLSLDLIFDFRLSIFDEILCFSCVLILCVSCSIPSVFLSMFITFSQVLNFVPHPVALHSPDQSQTVLMSFSHHPSSQKADCMSPCIKVTISVNKI